jgi:hypothetical protein
LIKLNKGPSGNETITGSDNTRSAAGKAGEKCKGKDEKETGKRQRPGGAKPWQRDKKSYLLEVASFV